MSFIYGDSSKQGIPHTFFYPLLFQCVLVSCSYARCAEFIRAHRKLCSSGCSSHGRCRLFFLLQAWRTYVHAIWRLCMSQIINFAVIMCTKELHLIIVDMFPMSQLYGATLLPYATSACPRQASTSFPTMWSSL